MGTTFEALEQLLDPRRHARHAVDAGPFERATFNFLGTLSHENGHHFFLRQRLNVTIEDAALGPEWGVRAHNRQLFQAFFVAN